MPPEAMPSTDVIPSDPSHAVPSDAMPPDAIPSDAMPPTDAVETVNSEMANTIKSNASQPVAKEDAVETQPSHEPEQPGSLAPVAEISQPTQAISAAPSGSQPLHEEKLLQTRNLVALKDLIPEEMESDEDGESDAQKSKNKVPWTWVEEMSALFGDHVNWGTLRVVPARNRPIYRRPPICPMTGLPAPYRDPQTGIPYANAKAYRTLQRLTRHEFVWSDGRGVYWADETEQGARGVPASWNGYVRGVMPGQQAGPAPVKQDVEMEDEATT